MEKLTLTVQQAEIIQRVVNLARHPMFPDTQLELDLPAWQDAVAALNQLIQDANISTKEN